MRPHRRAGLVLCLVLLVVGPAEVRAESRLRVFIDGAQRAEVMHPLLQLFKQVSPDVTVELQQGPSTVELRHRYLASVLGAGADTLDVMLIQPVRAAQYAAAGWTEPLDSYLGLDKPAVLERYDPAHVAAAEVNGQLVGMPAFGDVMLLYYRKDLLEQHGLKPPRTWEELAEQARQVLATERDPALDGVTFPGQAEAAICTFLIPYWSAGGRLLEESAPLELDRKAAERAFALWARLLREGLAPEASAVMGIREAEQHFAAGRAVFGLLWADSWKRLERSAAHRAASSVATAAPPGLADGEPATCVGGWQWVVSAFSKNKPAAYELVRFLSGPVANEHLARVAAQLPVMTELLDQPALLQAHPWFADAKAALRAARTRPKSPRYAEISEAVRGALSDVLARAKSPPEAAASLEASLRSLKRAEGTVNGAASP